MRAHSQSDCHMQSCEAELAAARATKQGSVIQQLQYIGEQQRLKNRMAIKALFWCTHLLAQNNIAHMTNYDKLIELIVSCGGDYLKQFLESTGRNATYSSKDVVTDFIEAIGQWVEESLLENLLQAPYFSICTDISTVEELVIAFKMVCT